MKESGNVVLITGGSSGIGQALAKKFREKDNKVIITGRNQDKLLRMKERFPDVITEASDLSKESDIESLAQTYKDVNILVNNAGVQYNYNFYEEANAINLIKQELKINLLGPILLARLFLPSLIKKSEAAIINVTSGLALVPKQSAAVYCGSKAGLHSFSKSLRYQLELLNIKVFDILPSLVDTAMTEGRGKEKISPEQVAKEFWHNFVDDKYEIHIGKVKLLSFINRVFPKLAEKVMR